MNRFLWWAVLALVAIGLLLLGFAYRESLASIAHLLPLWAWGFGLAVCVGGGWILRPIPGVPTNVWSYVFGAAASVTFAALVQIFVAFVLSSRLNFGPEWADGVGWAFGVLAGIALLLVGADQCAAPRSDMGTTPIPPGMGATTKLFGFVLPLELHTGNVWWPKYRPFGISQHVDLRLRPTDEITAVATAPNGSKVTAKISLFNRVVNVRWHLLYAEQADVVLLNQADSDTKSAIENEFDFGRSAEETSRQRPEIQNYVQEHIEDRARQLGMESTVIIREMLPAEEIMAAAARKEVERQEVVALAIESAGLTARVAEFAAANGISRNQAIAYLQVEGGKASRVVFTPEGVDQLAHAIEQVLNRFFAER